jgi:hypothetical protein
MEMRQLTLGEAVAKGRELKDKTFRGMLSTKSEIRDNIYRAIRAVIARDCSCDAYRVRLWMEQHDTWPDTANLNMVGAVFGSLSKHRVLKKTGYTTSGSRRRKAAEIRVYAPDYENNWHKMEVMEWKA